MTEEPTVVDLDAWVADLLDDKHDPAAADWGHVVKVTEAAIKDLPELDILFDPLRLLALNMQNEPGDEATRWELEVWASANLEYIARLRRFSFAFAVVMLRTGLVDEETLEDLLKPFAFDDALSELHTIRPQEVYVFFEQLASRSKGLDLPRPATDPLLSRLQEELKRYEQESTQRPSRGRRRRADQASRRAI